MSKTGTCFYRSLALLLSENKREKRSFAMRWRTKQNPLGGGRGCAVIEELFLAVYHLVSPNIFIIFAPNLKTMDLWQHSTTQQENLEKSRL